MRRWRLLKDLPWAKAGSVSYPVSTEPNTWEFGLFRFGLTYASPALRDTYLQEHPDWFEEIKPRRVLVIEVDAQNTIPPESWRLAKGYRFEVFVSTKGGLIDDNFRTKLPIIEYRIEERD